MVHTRQIEYSDNQMTYEGVVAYDTSKEGDRPIVLVAPTYRGQTDFEVEKAVKLAELGYIGFAIDTYGKGVRGETADEASKLMNQFADNRQELLKRMELCLTTAKGFPFVDHSKIGAIGFCFGGKSILDLARSGVDLSGMVSFHGVYDPPGINEGVEIKTPLLILHGWDDPLATPAQVSELGAELTRKKAIWELVAYGKTGHAFTNPNANDPEGGMFYNPLVDQRSWDRMKAFFEEVF